jgi:1-phosphofructokinase family hexose kinase
VQTNLNHEGPHVEPAELQALESKLGERLPEAVVMAVGGSLPPGVPTDIYAKMIERARASDVRTILDSSGDALAEGIKAHPYMIKPNIREAEHLLGRSLGSEQEVVRGAHDLLDAGIEVVVISMGPGGAIAVTKDAVWKAIPPEVHAQNTIGAGDSLVAGLAIGIFEDSGLDEALRLGTAAATGTVMSHGTELCRVEDVQALLPQVRVERVR